MKRLHVGVAGLLILFAKSDLGAATCENLQTLSLANTTITLAEPVRPGQLSVTQTNLSGSQQTSFADLPAFCRVAATLRPSADSDIKIEVWMPLDGWNNKFQAVGNGGFFGSIPYTVGGAVGRGMVDALKRGYAIAATDTGHTGNTQGTGSIDDVKNFGCVTP
jgi:tannase/feruloyl esterase